HTRKHQDQANSHQKNGIKSKHGTLLSSQTTGPFGRLQILWTCSEATSQTYPPGRTESNRPFGQRLIAAEQGIFCAALSVARDKTIPPSARECQPSGGYS
ncbi:hypothetical protein, partial [Sinomonas sp. G460-2]|uniref:hypothetical protein n=1 Tax=Sinomonas sp. G460-2 TaxID=3393464 RepID=UPI0039F0FE09